MNIFYINIIGSDTGIQNNPEWLNFMCDESSSLLSRSLKNIHERINYLGFFVR